MMKSCIKIFAALFAVAMMASGCTKETEDLIVGLWEVQYTSRTMYEDQATTRSYLNEDESWFYKFKKDNTGYIDHFGYEEFTYTINGETLTITTSVDMDGKGSGGSTYTETFNIDKLDEKEAVIRMLHESPDSDYRIHMKRVGN